MTALALCRFAHFMAAMLTFGMSEYLWLYAPERLKLALTPVARRLALIASLVGLVRLHNCRSVRSSQRRVARQHL